MALDPSLPRDAIAAQQLLAELAVKDQNDVICRYPTCFEPRRTSENGGRPPAFCANAKHTPLTNSRARAYVKDLANELPHASIETEQPATTLIVQSLQGTTLVRMEQFQEVFGKYVAAIRELSDPEVAAAQIEAAQHRANALIAAAQEKVGTERSLRLLAEQVQATAQQEALNAREEAARALTEMRVAEERARLQQEEYERTVVELQQVHRDAIEAIRKEAQEQIKGVKQQASDEISLAHAASVVAQEETRTANERAHDAQIEARLAIASAEKQVQEVNLALLREQGEVTRLREELTAVTKEAQNRAETDLEEIQRLRAELRQTILDARTRAGDDRGEIQQLRESLAGATKRADDLAISNDSLRSQLSRLQSRERDAQDQKE